MLGLAIKTDKLMTKVSPISTEKQSAPEKKPNLGRRLLNFLNPFKAKKSFRLDGRNTTARQDIIPTYDLPRYASPEAEEEVVRDTLRQIEELEKSQDKPEQAATLTKIALPNPDEVLRVKGNAKYSSNSSLNESVIDDNESVIDNDARSNHSGDSALGETNQQKSHSFDGNLDVAKDLVFLARVQSANYPHADSIMRQNQETKDSVANDLLKSQEFQELDETKARGLHKIILDNSDLRPHKITSPYEKLTQNEKNSANEKNAEKLEELTKIIEGKDSKFFNVVKSKEEAAAIIKLFGPTFQAAHDSINPPPSPEHAKQEVSRAVSAAKASRLMSPQQLKETQGQSHQ